MTEELVPPCKHEAVTQLSSVIAETFWSRAQGGGYELATASGPVAISRVVDEQTESWTCDQCGAAVIIGGDGQLEDV